MRIKISVVCGDWKVVCSKNKWVGWDGVTVWEVVQEIDFCGAAEGECEFGLVDKGGVELFCLRVGFFEYCWFGNGGEFRWVFC